MFSALIVNRPKFKVALLVKFCLIIVSLVASLQQFSQAQTIEKISEKKAQAKVDKPLTKGAKVCAYENEKKVMCGKVTKVSKDASIVQFSKSAKFKKLKPGMTITEEAGAAAGEEGDVGEEGEKAGSKDGKSKFMALHFEYTPAIMSATAFNLVYFQPPEVPTDPETMWDIDQKVASSFFAIGFGGEYFLSNTSGIGFGLRYSFTTPYEVASRYTLAAADNHLYMQNTTDYSRISFHGTYNYHLHMGNAGILSINSGLDFEKTDVSFSSVKKDDDDASVETEIFTYTGAVNVISARIDLVYTVLAAVGLNAGVGILLPVLEMGKSEAASYNNETRADMIADPQSDLISSIGLAKNSIGLELMLGAQIEF